ncbi:hypothetical protein GMD78_20955 [Ornithinibacillus sp. L9]|uniref:Uncharacterized protein n=1 Tax=Ornithinibacillus caprae TaxID=2678566 RepID=A0A6N8FMK0_9BACI|nr:hypothetical protein [Ornithinibacillus caprae]MUK90822.1 hypothetical protein [Ornithinibacillus caprae]
MQKNVKVIYPNRIESMEKQIKAIENDLENVSKYPKTFKITINGLDFTEEKEAGEALREVIKTQNQLNENPTIIGKFKGQEIFVRRNVFNETSIGLKGATTSEVPFKISDVGNIQRLASITENFHVEIEKTKLNIEDIRQQIKTTEVQLKKPFAYEAQLNKSLKEQQELKLKLEFADQLKEEKTIKRKRNKQ